MTEKQRFNIAGADGQLAEVWGDVISRPQLGKAILIGAALSVSIYLLALETIAPFASTPEIGKAFAMLAGIAGAVASGILCSVAFLPKRVLVVRAVSAAAWQLEVLEQLEQDEGHLGNLSDLPPVVLQEMRSVGLYGVFKSLEDGRPEGSRSDVA
jgi:hypothetical protein